MYIRVGKKWCQDNIIVQNVSENLSTKNNYKGTDMTDLSNFDLLLLLISFPIMHGNIAETDFVFPKFDGVRFFSHL